MLTASVDSTALIFMILFTGTAGITVPIYMIRSITLPGIHLHGHLVGEWDIAGTHPITVGDGATHHGTAHIMQDTTEAIMADGTEVIMVAIHGMAMGVQDILTLKTTGTDNVAQPAQA